MISGDKFFLETLPILDLDHPGASDNEYRKRRKEITEAAIKYHVDTSKNKEIPLVKYTSQEIETWNIVFDKLNFLHEKYACRMYKDGIKKLSITREEIPQLRILSNELQKVSGLSLEPIHGLISGKDFLAKLADNVMLCTQFIRHHSKPEFTPEPDIVHEVIGHLPMFANRDLVEFSKMVGKAARSANEKEMEQLSRLYWYTVEYGLIRENGEIKAFGAGLLGGIQDLKNAFSNKAIIKEFNLQKVINIDYNYSFLQPYFFVIPSFEFLQKATKEFLQSISAKKDIVT